MDWEEELSRYIDEYYVVKNESDKFKKIADEDNKAIKDLMKNIGMDEYSTEAGITAKVSTSVKESFNEPALIEKLNELNLKEAVELVPTINWDTIEDMIYNGKLNASELTPFKEEKEVVTLRISKKKGE
jgi:hypothetical protein